METAKQIQTVQEFYTQPGQMTQAGRYAPLLRELPADVDELCRIVQGLIVHIFWASRYGIELSEERKKEVGLRTMTAKLDRLFELDDHPLTEARPLEKKLVGNCRDISVFLASLLQYKGIPARARCGFGTYFIPGHYEDHWMTEYWHAEQQRWVRVDAQLDEFQQKKLHIEFDPHDMPEGAFVTGGLGWQLCRTGQADPDHFGIMDMKGLWFVQGDMIRDFLALNKVEILPWDMWGYMAYPEVPEQDLPMMDRLAALTLGGEAAHAEIRSLFASDPRLQPAADWKP